MKLRENGILCGTLICLFLLAGISWALAPERSKGISMHMLPKRVAKLSGTKWGFAVDFRQYLKPESTKPVLQTTDQFLAFVRKQDKEVQDNGVWIVITHPDAYSDEEKTLLEDVKTVCKKERIPLFVARASELPDGWQRFDQ